MAIRRGSIAVIATIIYLAIQVKQSQQAMEKNSIAIRGASEIQGHDAFLQNTQSLFSDPEMTDIVMRGAQDFESLSLPDQIRFSAFCHSGIQTHQITFMQWKKELLEDEYWSFCIRYTTEKLLVYPGAQQWWKSERHLFPQDYRNLVDRLSQEGEWKNEWKAIGKYLDREQFQ